MLLLAVVSYALIGRSSNNQMRSDALYVYGTNPVADEAPATPSTWEEKQQCAKDGAAWYAMNVTVNSTPQAISEVNSQLGTSDPSSLEQAINLGTSEYVYSTKLNTCLVDWAETSIFMDGSTLTIYSISDAYTNKTIAEWPVRNLNIVKNLDWAGYQTAKYNLIQQQN